MEWVSKLSEGPSINYVYYRIGGGGGAYNLTRNCVDENKGGMGQKNSQTFGCHLWMALFNASTIIIIMDVPAY